MRLRLSAFVPFVVLASWIACDLLPAVGAEQDGSWITFLSHRSGESLLYRMRPDGSECQPIFGGPIPDAPGLSEGMTLYREPHWTWQSPDRRYFVSWVNDVFRPQEKSQVRPLYSLFLGRTDGVGSARIMAPLAAEAAAWSPDSRRVAFSVTSSDDELGRNDPGLPRTTRIYVVAIDGTADDMIFQQPGYWQPEDWSPDGTKLLVLDFQYASQKVFRSNLVEIDMNTVKAQRDRATPGQPWQRAMVHRLQPVLATPPPAVPHGGRYSPDGRWIATVAFPKQEGNEEWKAVDFELGLIERATMSYRKVARYPEGLRGPICWSPDNAWILFSRPLAADDQRERPEGPQALGQATGLGIWAIKPDGTGERFLTTGWSPDWR